MAGSFDWWNPIDDVEKFLIEPVTKAISLPGTAIDDWLKSLGGQLASGLERGMLAWVADVWRVILPALQIALGVALVIIAGFLAKDNLGTI